MKLFKLSVVMVFILIFTCITSIIYWIRYCFSVLFHSSVNATKYFQAIGTNIIEEDF